MHIKEYLQNPIGEDYFVGDIHGEYDKLMDALCKRKFNFQRDLLWSVGDIVDRGPDSLKCLGLLEESWFRAVKGNHEQMMIDALYAEELGERLYARQMWEGNGGDWYRELPYEFRLRARHLASEANELPNGLKVGNIGVVHAECPLPDWDLLAIDSGNYLREKAMWSRRRIDRKENWKVRGVDAVVVGHTPTKEALVLGNHVYIDQGACFYPERGLTVLSYNEILSLVNK